MSDGHLPGPHVLHQVLIAATSYGLVARCGCGWKAVHETRIVALVSGQRHIRTAHPGTVQAQGDAA